MKLICYPLLATKSKRAICRLRPHRYGQRARRTGAGFYRYSPRGDLLQRLAKELNMTVEQVWHQLKAERVDLLKLIYPHENFHPWQV